MMAENPDQLNFDEIYNFAIEITRQCEDIFREGFYGVKNVTTKSLAWDIVTEFDQRIESMLKTKIFAKYPNHLFIGEETTAEKNIDIELTDEPTWIVDPIDGTYNFVNQIPVCGISVAFVYKKEIIVGVINSPITNESFTALKGNGSYLNGNRISTNHIQNHLSRDEILKCIRTIMPGFIPGVAHISSAALGLAYISNGTIIGIQINLLKVWDVAAGVLIIQEAGGVVRAVDGSEVNIMKPDLIAAANNSIYNEVVNIFKDIQFLTLDEIIKLTTNNVQ